MKRTLGAEPSFLSLAAARLRRALSNNRKISARTPQALHVDGHLERRVSGFSWDRNSPARFGRRRNGDAERSTDGRAHGALPGDADLCGFGIRAKQRPSRFASSAVSLIASKAHRRSVRPDQRPRQGRAASARNPSGSEIPGASRRLVCPRERTVQQRPELWVGKTRCGSSTLACPIARAKIRARRTTPGPLPSATANSVARRDLVDHWGNLFENTCRRRGLHRAEPRVPERLAHDGRPTCSAS